VEDLDIVSIDGHGNCALMKVLITGNLGYLGALSCVIYGGRGYTVELKRRGDDRGFFTRVFCQNEFKQAGLVSYIV
jgi:hypothetical protein